LEPAVKADRPLLVAEHVERQSGKEHCEEIAPTAARGRVRRIKACEDATYSARDFRSEKET
jgi:hypothetical protein